MCHCVTHTWGPYAGVKAPLFRNVILHTTFMSTNNNYNNSLSSITTHPTHLSCTSQEQLIKTVYNSLSPNRPLPSPNYFRDRAIISPKNVDIFQINQTILQLLPADKRFFQSADSYLLDDPTMNDRQNIAIGFLHTLNPCGFPMSNLQLKIGCLIILLQDIDTEQGWSNGMWATIKKMSNR
jgi:hypothetical protein